MEVIKKNNLKEWKLVLIGNGPLKEELSQTYSSCNIIFKDFFQPDDLIEEIKKAGIYCLPSKKEPWGVVIQEMAAAELPIICSDQIGSAEVFVKNGLNGYVFQIASKNSLYDVLKKIMIELSDTELRKLGKESTLISQTITPQKSVDDLLKKVDKWYS